MAKNEAEDNDRHYDADKATKEEAYEGKSWREQSGITVEDCKKAHDDVNKKPGDKK